MLLLYEDKDELMRQLHALIGQHQGSVLQLSNTGQAKLTGCLTRQSTEIADLEARIDACARQDNYHALSFQEMTRVL
jgi:hypothetical protein